MKIKNPKNHLRTIVLGAGDDKEKFLKAVGGFNYIQYPAESALVPQRVFNNTGTLLIQMNYPKQANWILEYALILSLQRDDKQCQSDCLGNFSYLYIKMKDYDKAISLSKSALELKTELKDYIGQSNCLVNLASLYQYQNKLEKSIEIEFQNCKLLENNTKEYKEIGESYLRIGEKSLKIEHWKEAVDAFILSTKWLEKADDTESIGFLYSKIGEILCQKIGDFEKAKEYLLLAKKEINPEKHLKEYLFVLNDLGKTCAGLKETMQGIKVLEEGLNLSIKNDYVPGITIYSKNLVIGYIKIREKESFQKNYKDCVGWLLEKSPVKEIDEFKQTIIFHLTMNKWFEEALNIGQDLLKNAKKDGLIQRYTFVCGLISYYQEDYLKALEFFKHHYKLIVKRDIYGSRAAVCYYLGTIFLNTGSISKSVQFLEEAKTHLSSNENFEFLSNNTFNYLGLAFHLQGKNRKAEGLLEGVLDGSTNTFLDFSDSACLSNLALTYKSLGKFERAIELLNQALILDKKAEDIDGMARSYINLGIAYYHHAFKNSKTKEEFNNRLKNSFSNYQNAEEIAIKHNLNDVKAMVSGSYGEIYLELKYFHESKECFLDAVVHYDKAGNIQGKIKSLLGLVKVSENKEALENLDKAIELARQCGAKIELAKALAVKARVLAREGQKGEQILNLCREAIITLEGIFLDLKKERYLLNHLSEYSWIYEFSIVQLIKEGKIEESFNTLGLLKSRALKEVLRSSRNISNKLIKELRPELLEKEQELLNDINNWQKNENEEQGNKAYKTELALQKLDNIYDQMKLIDPAYVLQRTSKTFQFKDIHDYLEKRRDLTVFEYFYYENQIYIFILNDTDTTIQLEQIEVPSKFLERVIFEDFFSSVVEYPIYGDIGDSWLSLGDYLITPIKTYLVPGRTACFVPYGALHFIPFHAMEKEGRSVLEYIPLFYVPTLDTVLAFHPSDTEGESSENSLIISSDFEEEGLFLKNILGGNAELINQPDKKELIEKITASSYQYIHITCHGLFNSNDPLSSGLKINAEEHLTPRDIIDLSIIAELVVLSACESGLNQRTASDDLIGLVRAFNYAGVSTVIVSLWKVEEKSTKLLMKELYRLLKKGVDKVRALQRAQLKVKEIPEYNHPYFWAGFVIVGS
jgi:CHAT domain-containing protein